MCCGHGKVKLLPLQVPPLPLYNLFTSNTFQAKEFQMNIVQYNAALASTSLGVKVNHSIARHRPPVFCIHRELSHLLGSLLPEESEVPTYSQLYVYDPHIAYQYCISCNENLSLHTMRILQDIMQNFNRYTPVYQHADMIGICACMDAIKFAKHFHKFRYIFAT